MSSKQKPLPYDASGAEPKWQKFWEEEGINRYEKESQKPTYSIDTPPPTISGNIHIGHIFSYTQAEVIARYKRMKGYNVFYPFGFDDNGLPTERLVEKELQIKGSEMERKVFVEKCLEVTDKYRKLFKGLWQSIGLSVDWDIEYSTISPFVQKISQESFLDLYKKGFVKRRSSPALWCTECQTSVAQAEVEDKELDSVFYQINFYTPDRSPVVIATTRPELLPACVAVFVHPTDARYKELVGKTILTPLDSEVVVYADEKVDPEKGTGVVMNCTYGDETDMQWVKQYKLPEKIILDPTGRIDGLSLKEARRKIVDKLRLENHIVSEEHIVHSVGVHERCGTPMEILPLPQWFIEILEKKNKFIERGNEIAWYPPYMKKRYLQWVENLKWDWCISRQRFFGIPVPVWYSKKTGEIILPSLDQLPIDPQVDIPRELPSGHTKDDIIPDVDVLDTWATSSLTPQINDAWREREGIKETLLPMNLRPQAHDIIRTWAFYTIVKSEYHAAAIPWKDIVISGHVLTAKGQKISKSKSNAKIAPETLIAQYSADAVRYWTCGASLGKNIFYDEDEIKAGKKLVVKLWNASRFAMGNLSDFNPQEKYDTSGLTWSDQWILLRFSQTAQAMVKHLDKYEFGLARIEFEKFFWGVFCDMYLEMIKARIYEPQNFKDGEAKKKSAQYALYHVLKGTLKLIAPYLPHITEEIYQGYFKEAEGEKSIHLSAYPDQDLFSSDDEEKIIHGMYVFEQLSNACRQFKANAGKRLNEEITRIIVRAPEEDIGNLRNFEDDIKGITRAKIVEYEVKDDLGFQIDL